MGRATVHTTVDHYCLRYIHTYAHILVYVLNARGYTMRYPVTISIAHSSKKERERREIAIETIQPFLKKYF